MAQGPRGSGRYGAEVPWHDRCDRHLGCLLQESVVAAVVVAGEGGITRSLSLPFMLRQDQSGPAPLSPVC